MQSLDERIVTVPNMSCGHCSGAIERELSDVDGVEVVAADHVKKTVRVAWHAPASWDDIEKTMIEIGYAPEK